MASTTGFCVVCGIAARVVLPEDTNPLMAYGGDSGNSLAVPDGLDVLCEEHAGTDVAAFRKEQEKATKAEAAEAAAAAEERAKAAEAEAKAAERAKADEEKAAAKANADAEAKAAAEGAPPAPARKGRSS